MNPEEMDALNPHTWADYFRDLPDPRIDRTKKHNLLDILVIGLCAMLTGGDDFTDMEAFGIAKRDWLETFLELPSGIPSHDTFNRVFSALSPEAFLACFIRWTSAVFPSLRGEIVAMDGKALRHARDEGATIPYIVSAWVSTRGLTLGQVKVEDKSNEITALPELIDALALKGATVTIDAMGCQKGIAARIVDKDAQYVLALKGNHATALEEIAAYFADAVAPCAIVTAQTLPPPRMDFFQTLDKGHGRIETRRYWQTEDMEWFQDKALWKGLRSFGMVESIRTVKGVASIERRYYLSSLGLDAKTFAGAVRGHWGVENPLHWMLDVTFNEDASRARTKYAAQNLATLRRLALNLLKLAPLRKMSVKGRRLTAALDLDYLKQVLGI